MPATIVERVSEKLGISRDQLTSLYAACPVRGVTGPQVAAELAEWFGLEDDESLGLGLAGRRILTPDEGEWLDAV